MKGRWLLSAFFLLPFLGASYMTWLSWRAGEGGQWLFGVFAGFFLLLAAAPILPELKRRGPPEPPPATRFVPHWFLMLALLVAAAAILAAIAGSIGRR